MQETIVNVRDSIRDRVIMEYPKSYVFWSKLRLDLPALTWNDEHNLRKKDHQKEYYEQKLGFVVFL